MWLDELVNFDWMKNFQVILGYLQASNWINQCLERSREIPWTISFKRGWGGGGIFFWEAGRYYISAGWQHFNCHRIQPVTGDSGPTDFRKGNHRCWFGMILCNKIWRIKDWLLALASWDDNVTRTFAPDKGKPGARGAGSPVGWIGLASVNKVEKCMYSGINNHYSAQWGGTWKWGGWTGFVQPDLHARITTAHTHDQIVPNQVTGKQRSQSCVSVFNL